MIPLSIKIPLSEVMFDINDHTMFDLTKYQIDSVLSVYFSDHMLYREESFTYDNQSKILRLTVGGKIFKYLTGSLTIRFYSVQEERDIKIDELLS